MIFETVPELRPRGNFLCSSFILNHVVIVATESTKPSQASSPPTNMTNPYPSPSNPPTNPAAPYNNPYGVGQGDLDPAFPPGPTGGGSLVGLSSLLFFVLSLLLQDQIIQCFAEKETPLQCILLAILNRDSIPSYPSEATQWEEEIAGEGEEEGHEDYLANLGQIISDLPDSTMTRMTCTSEKESLFLSLLH
jgi:hypothetical protein